MLFVCHRQAPSLLFSLAFVRACRRRPPRSSGDGSVAASPASSTADPDPEHRPAMFCHVWARHTSDILPTTIHPFLAATGRLQLSARTITSDVVLAPVTPKSAVRPYSGSYSYGLSATSGIPSPNSAAATNAPYSSSTNAIHTTATDATATTTATT